MNQSVYKNYSNQKKNKLKRVLMAVAIIAAVLLIAIWVIGLIVGSGSEGRQAVSSAISENVELKNQVNELTQQVQDLQAEVDSLQTELAAIPTQEPVMPTPAVMEEQSPRQ